MRLIPAVLVVAGVLFATPAGSLEPIPDTPEPWLYAVAMPPAEPAPPTVAEEPPVAPPLAAAEVPIVWPGPDTREQVLALPVTDVEKTVFGETVHVVAWYTTDGEPLETFVYERADGTRALVMRNDLSAYITDIKADPCFYDFFNGGTHC